MRRHIKDATFMADRSRAKGSGRPVALTAIKTQSDDDDNEASVLLDDPVRSLQQGET